MGPAVLLATPCTPRAVHGGPGTTCSGFELAARGSDCPSPLARFPELPYGSRCLEFEPRAQPGVRSLGCLCHPSNVCAKQGSAARRNVIPAGPVSAQQPRSEQRGSCQTPPPASHSLSAFLLPCLARLLPPCWLEGRELWGSAPSGCSSAFSSRARLWGQQGGSPTGGSGWEHPSVQPGTSRWRGHQAANTVRQRRASASQTLQSGGTGSGFRMFL